VDGISLSSTYAAVQAESKLSPFPGERIGEYVARAAGCSRDTFERYQALRQQGKPPEPDMAAIEAFLTRVGKRTAGNLDRFEAEAKTPGLVEWRNELERAVSAGWNPALAQRAAIQEECGFAPYPGEPLADYAARAGGVSRQAFEDFLTLYQAGKPLEPGMEGIRLFGERIGARVAAMLKDAFSGGAVRC
jgi:hypothetical protein